MMASIALFVTLELKHKDLQVEQLILDLAVQRQFDQTKREMEAMGLDAKSLQEELQAVQFSQDSKAGRMLMAKCRALQVLYPSSTHLFMVEL